ncbi:hypothetical protein Acr_00g0059430 [Actinidia rufa]|uniref:Uncharacterized protein n=1 Tax=Actinidia rufa TaxID=165716 RepID=A0A7J0DQ51_9ERIC|nr:hypothetical protein Acr_00g0059430 [Actinidia rufa]
MEGREERESEEDDEFDVCNVGIEDISDDFFEGLEELAGTATGDGFSARVMIMVLIGCFGFLRASPAVDATVDSRNVNFLVSIRGERRWVEEREEEKGC